MSREFIVLGTGGTLVGDSGASMMFCGTLRQTQKIVGGGQLGKAPGCLGDLTGMMLPSKKPGPGMICDESI